LPCHIEIISCSQLGLLNTTVSVRAVDVVCSWKEILTLTVTKIAVGVTMMPAAEAVTLVHCLSHSLSAHNNVL